MTNDNNSQRSTYQEDVLSILSKHRESAATSPYDAKVGILAISYAAQIIENYDWTNIELQDLPDLISKLEILRDNYNDTDGEYTSGKGEIGSLICDIRQLYKDKKAGLPKVKYYF